MILDIFHYMNGHDFDGKMLLKSILEYYFQVWMKFLSIWKGKYVVEKCK
jgi:hypothetical protein